MDLDLMIVCVHEQRPEHGAAPFGDFLKVSLPSVQCSARMAVLPSRPCRANCPKPYGCGLRYLP